MPEGDQVKYTAGGREEEDRRRRQQRGRRRASVCYRGCPGTARLCTNQWPARGRRAHAEFASEPLYRQKTPKLPPQKEGSRHPARGRWRGSRGGAAGRGSGLPRAPGREDEGPGRGASRAPVRFRPGCAQVLGFCRETLLILLSLPVSLPGLLPALRVPCACLTSIPPRASTHPGCPGCSPRWDCGL